ncbi:MAG: hypothetical protein H3Z53_09695, partial [archaeon]|nr:hypothetical protein [archaeon]
ILDRIELQIYGVKEDLKAILPKHPDDRGRGNRELKVSQENGIVKVFVPKSDKELLLSKPIVRLMGLMNIGDVRLENNYLKASLKGLSIHEAKMAEAPLIHWLSTKENVKIILVMFTGEKIEGLAERSLADEPLNSLVQLERLGFGRIDSKSDDKIVIYFTSR